MKIPKKKLKKAAMKKRLKVSNLIERIMVMLVFIVLIFVFEVKSNHRLDRVINDIFLLDFKGDFEKNVFGQVAFNTGSHYRLYHVRYTTNEINYEYKMILLSEIVDVSTWHEIENENAYTRKFEDVNNLYELFYIPDGIYFTCKKKENKAKTNNRLK